MRLDLVSSPTTGEATMLPPGHDIIGRPAQIRRVIHTQGWLFLRAPDNTFTLREAVATDFTITVPASNYTLAAFATALQTALNAVGAANTYVVTPTAATGIITMTLSAGATNFSFRLASFTRMAAHLGFTATDNAPAGVTIASAFAVRLAPAFVFLCCSGMSLSTGGPSIVSNAFTTVGVPPVVATLATTGAFTSQEYNEDPSDDYHFRISSNSIVFTLYDEFNTKITDTGAPYAVSLILPNTWR